MSIKYRIASSKDNENLKKLDSVTSTGELADYSRTKKDLFDVYEYLRRKGCFWLAEDNDKIVGMVGVRMGKEGKMKVKALRVHPKYQRQGIARKLMSMLEDYCKKNKDEEIILGVNRNSLPAIALYESLGYTRFKEIAYGPGKTVYFYKKKLT